MADENTQDLVRSDKMERSVGRSMRLESSNEAPKGESRKSAGKTDWENGTVRNGGRKMFGCSQNETEYDCGGNEIAQTDSTIKTRDDRTRNERVRDMSICGVTSIL